MALLVTLISFILATAVLAQAVHNVTQSGYLRQRLAAVHAAEAGLNWFTRYMSSATKTDLLGWSSASGWRIRTSDAVRSEPDDARFSVRVRYLTENPCVDDDGNQRYPCVASGPDPLASNDPLPDPFYAIVQSMGCAASSVATSAIYPSCPDGVARWLESAVRIHPSVVSAKFGIAGLLGTSLCFDSSGSLEMLGSVHVADPTGWSVPYATYPCTTGGVGVGGAGNVSAKIQDGSFLVDGPQALTISTSGYLQVAGDLQADGPIAFQHPGTPPTSCGGTDSCVFGDITSASTISGTGYLLGGTAKPNCASCPIDIAFPRLTYSTSVWDPQVWTIAPTVSTATDALVAAKAAVSPTVVRISDGAAGCAAGEHLDWPNNDSTIVLKTDVAIISDCGFAIGATDKVLSDAGAGSLILMSAWPGTPDNVGAPPTCAYAAAAPFPSNYRDIRIENNPTIEVPISVYTPCVLYLQNNSSVPVDGQFVGRFIWLNQLTQLAADPVLDLPTIPGTVKGFGLDIRYIKEIPSP